MLIHTGSSCGPAAALRRARASPVPPALARVRGVAAVPLRGVPQPPVGARRRVRAESLTESIEATFPGFTHLLLLLAPAIWTYFFYICIKIGATIAIADNMQREVKGLATKQDVESLASRMTRLERRVDQLELRRYLDKLK